MAVHASHAALPYPIKGCRHTFGLMYTDADGDPQDPTSPDTERSLDGAAFADCTEEVTVVSTGFGMMTATGDETNCSLLLVNAKGTGPKTTGAQLYPRVLPVLHAGTAQAGAAGTLTLTAGAPAYDLSGCIVRTTGGTGGAGGSGSLNNQARVVTAYNTGTKVATVVPNWETTPDATTTYEVLVTEAALFRQASVVAGGIVVGSFATDAVNAAALAADAVAEIADAVWDEATSGHVAAGTFGQAGQLIRAGTAQAGGASTITLDAGASATNDLYKNAVVQILAGTGAGQVCNILSYVGATKVATVDAAWATNPDATSVFLLRPAAAAGAGTALTANDIAKEVWKIDMASITGEAARSPLNAIRPLRNKNDLGQTTPGTYSVFKEDDSALAWAAAITGDSTAEPVVLMDPT